jgi:Uma2 family endonuclease
MPDTTLRRMTVEQFLVWEDGTDTRYELHQGVPVAMAPGVQAHQRLQMRLGRRIGNVLRGSCEAIADGGVKVSIYHDSFFVPDLLVTCEPSKPRDGFFTDPILIVEILSPSTAEHDREFKLPAYRAMPSVQEIVVMSAERLYAEVHRRIDDARWLTILHIGADASLELASVGFAVPLRELYADLGISDSQAAAASGQPNER